MPRRTTIRLTDIASVPNLAWAFWRAARGRRHQVEVSKIAARLRDELQALREGLLGGEVVVGEFRHFEIHDPKRRTIHAPVFRERVLHHALMRYVGPVLDRYLIDDTFACRVGKGGLAAARKAQRNSRRFGWVLKMDIRAYFASIRHEILLDLIRRRVRGGPVLDLIERIVGSFESSPGRGLPIGALTSQHFANLYLAPFDRYLLEELRVGGQVRYMDDILVWGENRRALRRHHVAAVRFLCRELDLEPKDSWSLQRTDRGVTMCGFRVFPHRLGVSQRRRRRYRESRKRWEAAYARGWIDSHQLQAGYASALAITHGADARRWRRAELERSASFDA